MSSASSQVVSPPPASSQSSNQSQPPPPHPMATSPASRRSNIPRPMSHASKNRLSQYSTASGQQSRSRPQSRVFAVYPSSLPYALVRDFAYPPAHPLHYGPPPEPSRPPSGMATPSSESRRLSDPLAPWGTHMTWETAWSADGFGKGSDVPPIHLGDGPPWSEDEDLQSPVVSSRHRKHKSSSAAYTRVRADGPASAVMDPANFDSERGYYVGTNENGGERYYVNQGGEANGPGGEFVTYPPDQARHSTKGSYSVSERQKRPFTGDVDGYRSESEASSSASSPGYRPDDQSRYSRDYQFTITSPDEEMHGKAVALFDFERESENELPLFEGQIILISYRHGQGWLVAQDPKTQESGLVPEEYVRLLRDIEGGMNSLTGNLGEGSASPNDSGTPTQTEHSGALFGHTPTPSNVAATNGYPQPVVSTFSTSTKDFDPYPTEQLGIQAGQAPPQVVHYHGQRGGSQANTPTLSFHQDTGILRRGSQDIPPAQKGSHDAGKRLDAAVPETEPTQPQETTAMDSDR